MCDYIINILPLSPVYIVAVKRCYESLCRNLTEQQEGKEDYVEDQAKRLKYRSRRQRVRKIPSY